MTKIFLIDKGINLVEIGVLAKLGVNFTWTLWDFGFVRDQKADLRDVVQFSSICSCQAQYGKK